MKYLKEVRYRLTPEEKSLLILLSQQEHMSQSAFVRRLIQMDAKKKGLWQSARIRHMKLSDGGERLG